MLIGLWGLWYVAIGSVTLHPMMAVFGRQPTTDVGRLSRRRLAWLTGAVVAVPVGSLLRDFTPGWSAAVAVVVLVGLVGLRVAGVVRELERSATVDPLTDLPNRASLERHFTRLLAARRRHDQSQLVVLFCDLDHFKVINDGLGHAVGDQILVTMAHRLAAYVRPGDVVARVGGDEFVVLLVGVTVPQRDRIVAQLVDGAAAPLKLPDGTRHHQTMSVGVAVADDGADVDTLLRDADTAMYRAKADGRARVVHFTSALHVDARTRLQLAAELHEALSSDQIFCAL